MKRLVTSLACFLLASCASQRSPETSCKISPDLSIVHLRGKVTQMPADSKWPASVKVGATFDYWAVINNAAKDTNSSPGNGAYSQSPWPARYDIVVGDLRFSSDRLQPNGFILWVADNDPPNDDGYGIAPGYHTSIPEAPDLKGVSFHVSLRTSSRDIITSDKLPFRPIAPKNLDGGIVPHFRGVAFAKSDDSNQTFSGKVDTFEVFQSCKDSPIGPAKIK